MRGSLGRIFKLLPGPVFSLIVSATLGRAASDSVVIRADSQEQVDEDHVRASGYVTIQFGNIQLTADEVEFWRETMRVVAEGNVVFEQGDEDTRELLLRARSRIHAGSSLPGKLAFVEIIMFASTTCS